ncbi:TetR family transcriptional regulator [Litchfieldella qijiaojingensis]|uniref:TetR family transcriptional regulator n=1 Tax=Litchfieldella qijiaojingensis TaxID=980347 RepID=A0ABQ2YTZ8_9GAMM|nr:CerR family C-terminal domain-containing protein [Halomonas qijiaojingensis]GGX94593.1 TetR family transcriptional regulator [Halomonas qijiaojingensis]
MGDQPYRRQPRDNTQEKLIQAGIRLFGELGYKATTTRMIADAAEANIGSIAYYFDNKHGLYLAAARYIAGQLRQRLRLDEATMANDAEGKPDRQTAMAALQDMTRRMVKVFTADDECRQWLLFVIREQATPTEAFDILHTQAFGTVQATLSTLIAILTERSRDDQRVIVETHTLIGQIVFFLICREPLLRRLGIEALDDTITATIEDVIASHLRVYEAD